MKIKGLMGSRLALHKDTLRTLGATQLRQVAGGDTAGPSVCVCSMSIEIACQGDTDFSLSCFITRTTKPINPARV